LTRSIAISKKETTNFRLCCLWFLMEFYILKSPGSFRPTTRS
jgi:propionate_PrpR: propionate catabolism operon regulatory protein PrpR